MTPELATGFQGGAALQNYPSKKFLNRTRLTGGSTQVAMPVNCSPYEQEMKIKTMKDALRNFEILH